MLHVLSAELIKYRRSKALAAAVGMPLLFIALKLLDYTMRRDAYLGAERWTWYWFNESGRAMWGILILPILAAVLAAFVCWLESEQDSWKLILVQPVRRSAVYAAKLAVCLLLVLVAQSTLAGATWLAGTLMGLPGQPPTERIFSFTLAGVLALWPLLAVQLWLSTRFQSFVIPIGIALVGNFLGFVSFTTRIGQYIPWSFPPAVLGANRQGELDWGYLGAGLLVGAVISTVGMLDFAARDVA